MGNVFLTVLNMSLTASYIIMVVLLARLLLRKAPRVFSYALWAVVLFRLLCPFAISSPVSAVPSAQPIPPGTAEPPAFYVDSAVPATGEPGGDYPGDRCFEGVTRPAGFKADFLRCAPVLWLAGAALLLGYSIISLLLLRRRLVGSVPVEGEKRVRLADHIPSPFVLGLFRPEIYLPSGLSGEELDYILLHERTHIRRGDHILRALAWLAVAVHWFNPLVWLSFRLAGQDMEMSCDEAVLRGMGRDIRADYSSSLLRLSAGKRLPAGPLAFGSGDIKSRVKNVLRYKKPAVWVLVLALAGVVCTGAALATNPAPAPDSPGPDGAGLSCSVVQDDSGPFVRVSGQVYGHTLERDAVWWAQGMEALFDGRPQGPGLLSMSWRFAGGPAELSAWWANEGHTSVTLSTKMSALLSSYLPVGYWEFTVDLTGGTVTAMEARCGEYGMDASLKMCPESIPDGEAVQAARVAASLLTAAENAYNNSTTGPGTESSPETAPAPDGREQTGPERRCLAVIQGNELLYSPEHGERMTLDELCAKTGPGYARDGISDFSVLDLDGDGVREVVLNLDRTYRQWCVVLHEQDGEVRGYAFYIRWLNTYTLKEDGAFDWSSGAFENGWGKLCFTEDGHETINTIWHMDMTYYLGDQAVSQEDYDAAYNRQEAVPDAIWYDFTPENLAAAFPA